MFNRLAKDDMTKYDLIEEQTYILCLNQLSLWKYQDEIQEWHYKQQQKRR